MFFSKNLKCMKIFLFRREKKMLLSQFCHLRRLVFNQSSPVHPVSESRGGGLSVKEEDGRRRTDILVSNIGYIAHVFSLI